MTDTIFGSREEEHIELNRWHQLCDQLKDLNAVTTDDLRSPVIRDGKVVLDTPGQRLLQAIRLWGDARVNLILKHRQMDERTRVAIAFKPGR